MANLRSALCCLTPAILLLLLESSLPLCMHQICSMWIESEALALEKNHVMACFQLISTVPFPYWVWVSCTEGRQHNWCRRETCVLLPPFVGSCELCPQCKSSGGSLVRPGLYSSKQVCSLVLPRWVVMAGFPIGLICGASLFYLALCSVTRAVTHVMMSYREVRYWCDNGPWRGDAESTERCAGWKYVERGLLLETSSLFVV